MQPYALDSVLPPRQPVAPVAERSRAEIITSNWNAMYIDVPINVELGYDSVEPEDAPTSLRLPLATSDTLAGSGMPAPACSSPSELLSALAAPSHVNPSVQLASKFHVQSLNAFAQIDGALVASAQQLVVPFQPRLTTGSR
jgi:hypothetical protein